MKRSRLQAPMGFFLAALIYNPAWGAIPPQPGTINYIEGQSFIGAPETLCRVAFAFYKKGCQEKKHPRELEAAKSFGIQPLCRGEVTRCLDAGAARIRRTASVLNLSTLRKSTEPPGLFRPPRTLVCCRMLFAQPISLGLPAAFPMLRFG